MQQNKLHTVSSGDAKSIFTEQLARRGVINRAAQVVVTRSIGNVKHNWREDSANWRSHFGAVVMILDKDGNEMDRFTRVHEMDLTAVGQMDVNNGFYEIAANNIRSLMMGLANNDELIAKLCLMWANEIESLHVDFEVGSSRGSAEASGRFDASIWSQQIIKSFEDSYAFNSLAAGEPVGTDLTAGDKQAIKIVGKYQPRTERGSN